MFGQSCQFLLAWDEAEPDAEGCEVTNPIAATVSDTQGATGTGS